MIDFKKNELVPAVAQDINTGKVLMQAYMNEAAFKKTKQSGLATYWSRSKKALWTKGETSGHFQHVKKILTDCDKDCVLLLVEQVGPACHKGTETCFGGGFESVVAEVDGVIRARKKSPKEGSYTTYLFEKGTQKICKKVGEEAAEVIISAVAKDKGNLVCELADLLYHSLVLMANEGVEIKEVLQELRKRQAAGSPGGAA